MSASQLRLPFESVDPDWRELEQLDADAQEYRVFDDHFGVCPYCGQPGVCLNVGRDHWFVCADHRVKWYVGSNLFSAWRNEPEVLWQRNAEKLARYRVVDA